MSLERQKKSANRTNYQQDSPGLKLPNSSPADAVAANELGLRS